MDGWMTLHVSDPHSCLSRKQLLPELVISALLVVVLGFLARRTLVKGVAQFKVRRYKGA